MRTNTSLTAALIDALSNLTLSEDIAAEVRGSARGSCSTRDAFFPAISQVLDVAVSSVSSVERTDLPAVVKFILQQISSRRSYEVCAGCGSP